MRSDLTAARPARLIVAVYGLWAAVLAIGGPQSDALPSVPQTAAGLAVAGVCFVAAFHPNRLLRPAFVVVAGYAMWSAARVVAEESYVAATAVAGATTYVTMAATALTTEAMTAVLQAIDAAADEQGTDE
jgi:hypothetical protein